jgi:integral membrane sensor domain MASE1
MKGRHNSRDVSFHIVHATELMSILAEEQSQAADKLERHTKKLVWLTWALLILTALLCVKEIVVQKDSCTKQHHDGVTNHLQAVKP